MKLDLETLKYIKFSLSTQCNGYRSLCALIKDEEEKQNTKKETSKKYESQKYSKYNSKTISCQNVFHVSNTCNFCGVHQKTATVFSALIRNINIPEDMIDYPVELSMFGITICLKCFDEKFHNDYNTLIQSHYDSDDNGTN